ncbi:MAG: DUF1499 domain-containing protein [Rubrobacter sp.]
MSEPRQKDPEEKPNMERTSQNSARATKHYPTSTADLAKALKAVAAKRPKWEAKDERDGEFRLVRTTRILRFKDDVTASVSPEGEDGSKLVAESASRVGKSDFGQNPRNLKELFSAVYRELSL